MTWVRIDDGYHRNHKVRAAGLHARALHLAGLCWTAANLKDGHIPRTVIGLIAAEAEVKPSLTSKLVDVGLWHATDDGWVINDFLEFNRSAQQVEKDRERWRGYKRGSTSDSAVEHTRTPRTPDPTPSPSPVSKSPTTTQESYRETDGGVAVVIELLTDAAQAAEHPPPRRPAPWRKSVSARLTAELGQHIAADLQRHNGDPVAVAQLHADPVAVRIAARSKGLLE